MGEALFAFLISVFKFYSFAAKLPHGIKAIRNHLETVDNVPLLVSLYTDATPEKYNFY